MASAGFLFVKADGAEIRGESTVTTDGRQDSIQVVELNHEVVSPVDSSAGSTSGVREHRILRVTARVDKAVPLMYQAWADNQDCEVEIRFWRPDPMGTGAEVEFFKIVLTGGRVAGVKMHWPNALRPETASIKEQVEYAFTYQKISWEMITGGIAFEDEWAQPS